MQYQVGTPSPRQREFFCSRARFTAYGGARGGGKSWAVRKKAALMALAYPGIRILVLRRTYPELRENHILPMLADLKGVAVYRETDKSFTFPGSSRILFGCLDGETDVTRYQGQEFDVIFLDEATQFTEWQFRVLTACLRGANEFPKRFYLTCNPGGVGHAWVKRLFVSRRYQPGEHPEDYRFIPARVFDNRALMENDPGYVAMLNALPPDKKAAWLEGNWDVLEGQFFPEFNAALHVVEPFVIPGHWRRYLALDCGLDMLAAYWAAMDEKGGCYIYREIFESGLLMSEAARCIRQTGERTEASFAPPDLWNRRQDTGRSVADAFGEEGVYLTKVSNDRVMGWMELKEWLKNTPETGPKLRIFSTCHNLIESMPGLVHSTTDPNDAATEPHRFTHAPDALRYLAAGRPQAAQPPAQQGSQPAEQGYEEFLSYGR